MAKKRPGKPESTKPNRSPSVTIFTRIDPALGGAFIDYVESIRPKTTQSGVIEMLIEKHLTELGLWPPQPPSDPVK